MKGSDRITFIRRAFCLAVVSLWLGLLTSPLCLAEVRSVNPSGSNFGKIQVKIQRPDLHIRNNFQWEITGKEAVITGYTGESTELDIPASVTEGSIAYPVTAIGSKAFADRTDLTRVGIPDDIRVIGSYAFAGCSGLLEVALPRRLEQIGSYAFADCQQLETVDIPAGVRTIGIYAFAYCERLREAWFLGSMPEITRERVNWNPVLHAMTPASLIIDRLGNPVDWAAVFKNKLTESNLFRIYFAAGSTGWIPSKNIRPFYRVTYDLNGGTGILPEDAGRYQEGSQVQVLEPAGLLEKPEQQFSGWNTRPDGSGTDYPPGSSLPVAQESAVLYARWIPAVLAAVIRLIFDPNGGTGSIPSSIDARAGQIILLPAQGELTRPGYRLKDGTVHPMAQGSPCRMTPSN